MAPMVDALSIRESQFAYQRSEKPALHGITLSQAPGQVMALVGPSGAGKSSLVSCLNGIIPRFFKGRFRGTVELFGRDISQTRTPDLADTVGVVLQDFESQLFSTSVELDVAFGPENLGLAREEIEKRIVQRLELVGLSDCQHRDPSTLSGGQKQRLAIASILAMRPGLIVLDEATTDKGLWRVERAFREEKSTLEVRPLYHHQDETRIGHIVASFLALRLEVDLQRRMEEKKVGAPWPDLMRGLKEFRAVRMDLDGVR